MSLSLLKCAHLIALAILAKSIESFEFAAAHKIKSLTETGFSDAKIQTYKTILNNEIEDYKNMSVKAVLRCHNDFFSRVVEFDDWHSAMLYLEKNRTQIYSFLAQKEKQ